MLEERNSCKWNTHTGLFRSYFRCCDKNAYLNVALETLRLDVKSNHFPLGSLVSNRPGGGGGWAFSEPQIGAIGDCVWLELVNVIHWWGSLWLQAMFCLCFTHGFWNETLSICSNKRNQWTCKGLKVTEMVDFSESYVNHFFESTVPSKTVLRMNAIYS